MDFWFHVLNIGLIVSILGFALNLLIGYTGLVSMMHGAIYGLGAYAAAITSVRAGVPFPLTILIAVVVAAGLSLLTAWPALRVKGEYLILLTLALQVVASGVFVAWTSMTGGSGGIGGVERPVLFGQPLIDPPQWLPVLLLVFAVALIVAWWVGHSPFGRVLKAVRENESATLALGKSVTYYKVSIFGVSGALAGLGGGAFAHYQAFVNPVSFSLNASIFLIAVVVLGGAGNLLGTLVGALLLASLPEVLRFLDLGSQFVGLIQKFLYGALLVLFMLYRPQGLIPEHARLPWRRNDEESRRSGDRRSSPDHHGTPSAVETDTGVERQRGTDSPVRVSSDRDAHDRDRDGLDSPRRSLTAEGLRKTFGGVTAADKLNLELAPGSVTALVGPNGAGKTTVFNLLTGFIPPDAGTVRIGDQLLDGLSPWQRVHAGLARSWQDVRLFQDLSVIDNVMVAIPDQEGETLTSLFGRPTVVRRQQPTYRAQAEEHLRFVGMAGRADDLVSSLAYGQQKLVAMARLAATDAEILLLDEPAAGVDRQWVDRILELIERLSSLGHTICIVEHNLDVVRAVAQSAYFMDTGRIIAEGHPEDLIRDPELADRYFGTRNEDEVSDADG